MIFRKALLGWQIIVPVLIVMAGAFTVEPVRGADDPPRNEFKKKKACLRNKTSQAQFLSVVDTAVDIFLRNITQMGLDVKNTQSKEAASSKAITSTAALHAHVVQSFEQFKSTLIEYGLRFLSIQQINDKNWITQRVWQRLHYRGFEFAAHTGQEIGAYLGDMAVAFSEDPTAAGTFLNSGDLRLTGLHTYFSTMTYKGETFPFMRFKRQSVQALVDHSIASDQHLLGSIIRYWVTIGGEVGLNVYIKHVTASRVLVHLNFNFFVSPALGHLLSRIGISYNLQNELQMIQETELSAGQESLDHFMGSQKWTELFQKVFQESNQDPTLNQLGEIINTLGRTQKGNEPFHNYLKALGEEGLTDLNSIREFKKLPPDYLSLFEALFSNVKWQQ